MKPSNTALPGHFPVLDLLRAAAALAVFSHHIFQQYRAEFNSPVWASFFEHLGPWGVSLFFSLSGFCIHWSRLSQDRKGIAFSRWAYASRRFFRIYPAFFVCVWISYVLGNQFGSNLLPASHIGDVLAHLLLLSSFIPEHRDAVNNVLWSVVLETHFYMLYGAIPMAFSSLNRTLRSTVFALLVGAITFLVSVLVFQQGPTRVMIQHTVLASWWTWCLGALVAELLARGKAIDQKLTGAVGLALLALSFVICFAPSGLALQLQRFALPFISAGILMCSLCKKQDFGRHRVAIQIGVMSYSLYLMHPIAILIGVHSGLATPPAIAFTLLMGFLLSYLGYRLIELPGIQLGKRFGV